MDKMIHPWCFLTSATCAYICNYFLHKISQKHFKKLKIFSHNQYVLCSVAQLYMILFDPIDCSPPSSSVHGDSPDKNTEVGCHALLQEIVPTQELSLNLLCVLALAARFFTTSHLGSPGGILLSHKKECIWLSSNEVGEPRAYTE